jgi:hypothetical protein
VTPGGERSSPHKASPRRQGSPLSGERAYLTDGKYSGGSGYWVIFDRPLGVTRPDAIALGANPDGEPPPLSPPTLAAGAPLSVVSDFSPTGLVSWRMGNPRGVRVRRSPVNAHRPPGCDVPSRLRAGGCLIFVTGPCARCLAARKKPAGQRVAVVRPTRKQLGLRNAPLAPLQESLGWATRSKSHQTRALSRGPSRL